MPLFDLKDAAGIMQEIGACRRTFPNHYVKVNAFDSTRGIESLRLSFIAARPQAEPGFGLTREEGPGRNVRYTLRAYAAEQPEGRRY
ncbi:MAG: ribulose bisphosphate carboxylase small subunit, partial [Steroidobacteraceae bacterium]